MFGFFYHGNCEDLYAALKTQTRNYQRGYDKEMTRSSEHENKTIFQTKLNLNLRGGLHQGHKQHIIMYQPQK